MFLSCMGCLGAEDVPFAPGCDPDRGWVYDISSGKCVKSPTVLMPVPVPGPTPSQIVVGSCPIGYVYGPTGACVPVKQPKVEEKYLWAAIAGLGGILLLTLLLRR